MNRKQVLLWNSIVWAIAVLACAVVLKGSDEFLGVLVVLLCGAVGSDAVVTRLNGDRPQDPD